jgi:type II restriction/modification system DNA methylase subunit YeeA
MKLLSKLIKSEKRKCLVCEKKVDKNFAEVQYTYQGGVGTAFLCSKCGDEMDNNRLEQERNDDLAV